MRRPVVTTVLSVAVLLGAGWLTVHRLNAVTPLGSCEVRGPAPALEEAPKPADRLSGRTLRLPTGEPASMSCDAARRVVAQARAHLASEPDPVDPRALADGTVDWLDPHGLWSASPDAPARGAAPSPRARPGP